MIKSCLRWLLKGYKKHVSSKNGQHMLYNFIFLDLWSWVQTDRDVQEYVKILFPPDNLFPVSQLETAREKAFQTDFCRSRHHGWRWSRGEGDLPSAPECISWYCFLLLRNTAREKEGREQKCTQNSCMFPEQLLRKPSFIPTTACGGLWSCNHAFSDF